MVQQINKQSPTHPECMSTNSPSLRVIHLCKRREAVLVMRLNGVPRVEASKNILCIIGDALLESPIAAAY